MISRAKPTKRGKERAAHGYGEITLKGLARTVAARSGHRLGNFKKSGDGWRARCRICMKMVIIDRELKRKDGSGIGGSAIKEKCIGVKR